MIKGIRWHFVVLFLAASIWIASSLNINHRQKRQFRNSLYLRPLRNGRYLPPIPIHILSSYLKERPEPVKHESKSNKAITDSPWIPMKGSSIEEAPSKNDYVPPIPPPQIIVTRKPLKTTFDVPLTKTIQVSQGGPKIQTTGYIRKNLVKIYATRTTTENPRQASLGSLAESTVQTLLNFTPLDDSWKPNVFTTPYSIFIPNHEFGENLGSKVDKHLNYTGMRYGKINSVMESSLPQNSAARKVLKNETNYVMRFTPEDVKFASVEVKTENIDAPFPEVKYLNGELEDHRTFFDGFGDSQKTSDLRNEGNIPYQGHKTSMRKLPTITTNQPKNTFRNNYKDRKTVFDDFPYMQKTSTPFKNKDTASLQGQGFFVKEPYKAEKVHPTTRTKERGLNQKEKPIRSQQFNENAKKVESTAQYSNNDNLNSFLEPLNAYDINTNDQIKSNFPYQGHATVVKRPDFSTNSGYGYRDKFDFPSVRQQTLRPSIKPAAKNKITKSNEKSNDHKVNGDLFKSSPQNSSASYQTSPPFINKDSISENSSPNNGGTYKYTISDSISYQNNNTDEKDVITVEKAPLTSGVQYDKPVLPNKSRVLGVKNIHKDGDVGSNQKFNIHQSSPKSQSIASTSHEEASRLKKNKDNKSTGYNIPNRSAFEEAPKLKETELKNPPEYLQFGDEDFLRPVIPVHFEKGNVDPPKIITSFTYPARTKSEDLSKHETNLYKESQNEGLQKNIQSTSHPQKTASKVEYYENSKFEDRKPEEAIDDGVYFQPMFPDTFLDNHHDLSRQIFQNYNSNDQIPSQISEISKEEASKTNSVPTDNGKGNSKSTSYDTSREKHKINKEVIVTKEKNANYSPEDTRRNNIRGPPKDLPEIITPPPVITVKYDPTESDDAVSKRGSVTKVNRTENYVIQRKPSLLPESAGRPRKPKITISTGMLAGILIAALVFLGFLTGSMVYAFHQWKFGRSRKEKKKKTRNSGFPPEYLDENFAGNTYIHNNIFLPTPQNIEERTNMDPDTTSMTGEVIPEQPSTSSRTGRYRTYSEAAYD